MTHTCESAPYVRLACAVSPSAVSAHLLSIIELFDLYLCEHLCIHDIHRGLEYIDGSIFCCRACGRNIGLGFFEQRVFFIRDRADALERSIARWSMETHMNMQHTAVLATHKRHHSSMSTTCHPSALLPFFRHTLYLCS